MTSGAPAKCCTIGVKHEGTPTGEIKLIGESMSRPTQVINCTNANLLDISKYTILIVTDAAAVPAYFAYPESKSTKLGILILTDVIGYGNSSVQLYGYPQPSPKEHLLT